jgi:hypothetical protein
MNKRFVSHVPVWLAAFCVVSFMASGIAVAQSADDLTSDKLNTIKQQCSSSQFALQQIEKRDAVSRINRGRAYDQMLRQISAINSRFAYNKINAPDLLQLTTDLQASVDKFRANYDKYDTDISDALKVDCKTKPAEYYQLIVKARNDRTIVGDQVNVINDLMNQYRDAILKYKDTAQ